MRFDKNYFIKQDFTRTELDKYKKSAKRDLDIAGSAKEPEVIFHFAYMALIKMGIFCLAKEGYRIKSRPGHHQKIIESLSVIMDSDEILVAGEKMRKERNLDFYSADALSFQEDTREIIRFVQTIYNKLK